MAYQSTIPSDKAGANDASATEREVRLTSELELALGRADAFELSAIQFKAERDSALIRVIEVERVCSQYMAERDDALLKAEAAKRDAAAFEAKFIFANAAYGEWQAKEKGYQEEINNLKFTLFQRDKHIFGQSSERARNLQADEEVAASASKSKKKEAADPGSASTTDASADAAANADAPASEGAEASGADNAAAPNQGEAQKTEKKNPPKKRQKRDRYILPVKTETVVIPPPTQCDHCGGSNLRFLGEDTTYTSEILPRHHLRTATVRQKLSCVCCDKISQPPAPFHPFPRGGFGPNLAAEILVDKFEQHIPLNRQSVRFLREGVYIPVSTMCDMVGHAVEALRTVYEEIEKHVKSGYRIHADDTTIPIWSVGKCITGRIWGYLLDDMPFGSTNPPAVVFYATPNRRGEHPENHLADFAGRVLQVDCYSGFNGVFEVSGKFTFTPAYCYAHARRNFYKLADYEKFARSEGKGTPPSPIAAEAVQKIDGLMEIERQINGKSAEDRRAVRQEYSKPKLDEFLKWMEGVKVDVSASSPILQPINYMLTRRSGFSAYIDDGKICMTNKPKERALRGIAIGRKVWLFAGSQVGADRCAFMLSLIETCHLNDVDPRAWFAEVLRRLPDLKTSRIHELLPWNWRRIREEEREAARREAELGADHQQMAP
jgi:transposase